MAEFPALPIWTDAYLADTLDLSAEQHGVYVLLLMIAWRRPSCTLPDDMEWIKRAMKGATANMHGNRFNAVVPAIIDRFFRKTETGELEQKRLRKERDFLLKTSENNREKSLKRWDEYRKNKELADADASIRHMPPHPHPHPQDKESISRPSVARPSDPDLKLALDAWNVTAAKTGLPVAQRLTDPRARKLAARLAECGGIDGWKSALAKLEASAFLTGQKTDWRADFDFMLQAKSFTKLMEGAYDNQPSLANGNGHFNGRGPNHGGTRSVVQIMADVARRMEKKGPHN